MKSMETQQQQPQANSALNRLRTTVEAILITSGRLVTEQSRAGQSSLNAKRAIQNGVNRFHDALDELEQELGRARFVLQRDLSILITNAEKDRQAHLSGTEECVLSDHRDKENGARVTGPATPDVQSDANDDNQHLSSLSSELPSPNLVDPPREADLTINEPDETEGIGDLEKVAKDETEKNVDDEKAEHAGNEVIHRDENGDAGNLATNSTPDEQASNTRQVSIAPSSNIDQLDRELFGKTPTTAESRQFDFDGLFESNSAHGNVMPQETVDIPTKESSVEALDGVGNTVLGISTSIDEDIVPMPEIPDMEAVLLSGLEDYANTDLDLAIVSNLPTSTQPQINDLQEVVGLAIVGSDSQAEVRLPQDDEIVQVQGDLTGDGYDGPAHTSGEPSFDDIFSDANLEAGDVAELEIGGGSTEFDDAFFNLQ